MPLYDYECRSCGHAFEIRQSFHDEPLNDCPVCAKDIRRVIAPVGIVFKGGGYYVTDSRKSGTAKQRSDAKASSSSKTEDKAGSGSEPASESKPAARDKPPGSQKEKPQEPKSGTSAKGESKAEGSPSA